jgi:hypothetical protein
MVRGARIREIGFEKVDVALPVGLGLLGLVQPIVDQGEVLFDLLSRRALFAALTLGVVSYSTGHALMAAYSNIPAARGKASTDRERYFREYLSLFMTVALREDSRQAGVARNG